MKQPIISIIIPFFNVPLHLFEHSLKSVCCQGINYDEVEVIVVNDGSTIDPIGVIEKDDFKVVKYISQENSGPGGARNTGLKIARGTYILFIDGDDYLIPNAINELVEWVKINENKQHPSDLLSYGHYVTGQLGQKNDGSQLHVSTYDVNSYFCHHNLGCTVWRYLFRRDLVMTKENPLLFEENLLHEDELWVPQMMLRMNLIDVTEKPIYCYYSNENSIMRKVDHERSDKDWIVAVKKLHNISIERNQMDFFEVRFRKSVVTRLYLLYYRKAGLSQIERYVKDLCEIGIPSFTLPAGMSGITFRMRWFARIANFRVGRLLMYKLLF